MRKMDVNCIKERKLNSSIREGLQVLARIIVREYLKTQIKNDKICPDCGSPKRKIILQSKLFLKEKNID